MNVILYKFKSEKKDADYRIINLREQNYITVEDLKRQICLANNLVQSPKNYFDLLIKDEGTNESYTDDKLLIHSNKRLQVLKIPTDTPKIEQVFKRGNDAFAGIPRSKRDVDHSTWVPPPIVEKKPEISLCGICKNEISDAAMTPCCSRISCYECITDYLLESDEDECPYCHKELKPLKLITVDEKSADLKKTSVDQPTKQSMTFHQPSSIVSTYEGRATIGSRSQPFMPTTPDNQVRVIMGSQKHDMPFYQPNHYTYTDPQQFGSVVSVYPGHATMGSHQPNQPYYDQRMGHQPRPYFDPQLYTSIPPGQGVVPKIGSRFTSNPQPTYIDDTVAEFKKIIEEKDRKKESQRSRSERDRSRDSEYRSRTKRDRSSDSEYISRSERDRSRSKRDRHGDD